MVAGDEGVEKLSVEGNVDLSVLGFARPMGQAAGSNDSDSFLGSHQLSSEELTKGEASFRCRHRHRHRVLMMTGITGTAILGFRKCKGNMVAWSKRSSSENVGSKPPSRQAASISALNCESPGTRALGIFSHSFTGPS